MSPERFINRINAIRHDLHRTDLRPSPTVNALFSELVDIVLTAPPGLFPAVRAGLGPAAVDDLRELCGRGETRLETAWAQRLLEASDPFETLEEFPYLDNYRRLTRLELSALHAAGAHVGAVTMIGSGPLPLTAVVLAMELGITVTVVDRDPHSLAYGHDVIRALGLGRRITSHLGDATDGHLPVGGSDAVILAALVGVDVPAKADIMAATARAMADDSHLLVRSAAGMRALLYCPFDLHQEGIPAIGTALTPVVELHPHDDVVNSVLVFRRTAHAASGTPSRSPERDLQVDRRQARIA
ncbi:nicotianamine synthase family protein [Arsenicicoccus dermatophilus]|uniref:nicotianamine synthase family protein n=1 Tax=Arsenicicoccus dermatophilus TaxID=1076331 RepID=UPI00391766D6